MAAPTTGGSQPSAGGKRPYRNIDEAKKLKLVRAVKLGLSVGRAARIVKMSTPCAHLVLRECEQSKRARLDA